MMNAVEFVDIDWSGRRARIEYQWIRADERHAPLIVFLHEGLGSLSMWKDFPHALCAATRCHGLVFSRPGYGGSTPRSPDEFWGLDFMHRQAREVLPSLLHELRVDLSARRVWLFGHSDGGSIALLYAAAFPEALAGAVVVAPHILVEDLSIKNIERARTAYLEAGLRERLARYHLDPDSAFWGWNRIWLDPAFRRWSIEAEISTIRCPLLAIQGLDDEYGTLEQIRGIARRVPQAELVELGNAGHSPHRDQPGALMGAVAEFIPRQARAKGGSPLSE